MKSRPKAVHWSQGTIYYRRYVDDIICCFKNSNDARLFFEYLNSCHPNIKFTMETEEKGQLPFLDVFICYRGPAAGGHRS